MNRFLLHSAVLLLALTLRGQAPAVAADPLSAESLRGTLAFLTDDALQGRDTPSPGLRQARDYLIERVRAAGLQPGVGAEFVHRYKLDGVRFDGAALKVEVWPAGGGDKLVLEPGKDVRLWRAEAAFDNQDVQLVRFQPAAPGADRLAQRPQGRRPVVFEVEPDSTLWQSSAGTIEKLGRRGGGSAAPWLLVRKGLLPEGELHAAVNVGAPVEAEVALENVVAVLPCEGAKEWVVFSAHYDHIGIGAGRGGDFVNNGADDNASGSSAVLALAQAFAAQRPKLKRNLAFVWFSAEEKGLRGSHAFVADSPFPLADIAAVVNLEMLGRPPQDGARKAWVTGDDLSDFAAIATTAMQRAGIEVIDFAMADGLFAASDNLPFAERGVVAHSISAGSLHQDYHQPGDELSKIDLEHMSAVVRGIYDFGVELATRAERPAYNDKGKQRLQARPRRR